MRKIACLILLIFASAIQALADNNIRILPDTTNKTIIIECSRNNTSTYEVKLLNEQDKVLYKSSVMITPEPTLVQIDWQHLAPGFYYVILKSKKEKIKLMCIKK